MTEDFGSNDVVVSAPAKSKFSPAEYKFLNDIRADAEDNQENIRTFNRAADVVRRFRGSPLRARTYEALTAQDSGSFLDTLGGGIGDILRMGGGLASTNDFIQLRKLQQEGVIAKLALMKGVQTDKDAARAELAALSPYDPPEVAAKTIGAGMLKSQLAVRKPEFFTKWANRYGLNGLDERGRSVDEVWRATHEMAAARYERLRGQGGGQNSANAQRPNETDALLQKYGVR